MFKHNLVFACFKSYFINVKLFPCFVFGFIRHFVHTVQFNTIQCPSPINLQLLSLSSQYDSRAYMIVGLSENFFVLLFSQMKRFPEKTRMSNVYRPTQHLNGRHVFASPAIPPAPSVLENDNSVTHTFYDWMN